MQELSSLNELRNNIMSTRVRKNMTMEDVYKYIGDKMESNNEIKLLEEQHMKIDVSKKDKTWYRNNFNFYFNLIKRTLTQEGIKVIGQKNGESVTLSLDEVAKDITASFVGFDCLEDAIDDDEITDIYCIAWNDIWVEKKGKNEVYPKHFRNPASYKNFVDRLLRDSGKQLDSGENKIVDFEIYGNRGNVINQMISTKGICLTMRKHAEDPVTLPHIVDQNLLTQEIADMLGMFIEGETNLIYAGITGSGKTTTIRALLDHYISKLNKRILVLEDTQELFLKNPHTVDLTTFPSEDPKINIGLRELNISALRMKPKYIIVGEVRGAEAESAVEGMETGHSTIFTMHGGNVWNIINRLVTKYLMQMPSLGIDVVERIIGSAVNFVCIQDDVPGVGRKLTSVHQISYDFEKGHVVAAPILKYNFSKKDWIWCNTINPDIANTMTRRGVAVERVEALNNQIMDHMKAQGTYKEE